MQTSICQNHDPVAILALVFIRRHYTSRQCIGQKNLYVRYGGAGIFVREYRFEPTADLKMLVFDSMDKDWLEFIKENRTHDGLSHEYDLVRGAVANDNTMRTIALYVSGIYTAEMALEQLRFFKANDQISFHTQKALACLQFIKEVNV